MFLTVVEFELKNMFVPKKALAHKMTVSIRKTELKSPVEEKPSIRC